MTVRELIARLGFKVDDAAVNRWERAINKAKRAMKSAQKAARQFAAAVRKMAVGAGVAAGAMLALVKKVADVGDQAAKDAKKLGLTAEAVQELSHAAKLSGSNVGTMKTGLQALARGLNDATTKGTGPAAEAFEQLGLSLDDPAVKSNDLNAVMDLVADRFEEMPNGAKKTALAMKLFSRSGAELIPMLNEGSRGIGEMRKEARDLGLVMSNEMAAESERFNDDLERTQGMLFGVAATLATDLMPTVRRWMRELRSWIGENKELIRQKFEAFVTRTYEAVQELVPVIINVVSATGDLVDAMGGADKALMVVVGTMGAMKLATLAAVHPYVALGAAAFAAGAAIGKAMTAANARIGTTLAMLKGLNALRQSHIDRGQAELDDAEAKKKAKRKRKVAGFAPELLDAGDGTIPVQGPEAREIDDFITARVGKIGARAGTKTPDRRDQAEAFAIRQAEARRAEARRVASELFLQGASSGDIKKAIDSQLLGRSPKKRAPRGAGRGNRKRKSGSDASSDTGLSADEILERDFGSGLGTSPSGSKIRPSLGTTINKITNSFEPRISQEFRVSQNGGESSDGFAQRVADIANREMDKQFARGYEHFTGATAG